MPISTLSNVQTRIIDLVVSINQKHYNLLPRQIRYFRLRIYYLLVIFHYTTVQYVYASIVIPPFFLNLLLPDMTAYLKTF